VSAKGDNDMTKQGINLIANPQNFKKLATFETIDQLNEAVREHKARHKSELTKSSVRILNFIQRFSAKYIGVSFLTKNNIADKLEISRRTVIRCCQQLEDLGIIKQYEMKRRSDMLQTSNAIVIQPVNNVDVTQDPEEMSRQEDKSYSLKQNHYIHNTYPSGPVPATPYAMFKQFVNNFVNDPKLTNRLYGIYLAQSSYIRDNYDSGELLNIGLQAIKETFQATKRKKLRNITGYYHGTICRMYDRLQLEDRIANYYAILPDTLTGH
jgi:DNA-binding Lrp family transcriptional regulator